MVWHSKLSHTELQYITLLSKKEVVNGLPKLTYVKDQLCSSCEMSKAKRSSFKPKAVPSSKGRLNLPSSWTCVDETPEVLKDFLTMNPSQSFKAQVITVRERTEERILEQDSHAYFKE
ncbi:retrovirus-related pol polyprotein from transposon TNT 1-94 [Tanacetum coccineum]